MTWIEFANEIGAECKNKSNGFVVGDLVEKEICKAWEDRQLKITKRVRRSSGASSHYNVEQIELDYFVEKGAFGKVKIRRKNLFARLAKKIENQYEVEGDEQERLQGILQNAGVTVLVTIP